MEAIYIKEWGVALRKNISNQPDLSNNIIPTQLMIQIAFKLSKIDLSNAKKATMLKNDECNNIGNIIGESLWQSCGIIKENLPTLQNPQFLTHSQFFFNGLITAIQQNYIDLGKKNDNKNDKDLELWCKRISIQSKTINYLKGDVHRLSEFIAKQELYTSKIQFIDQLCKELECSRNVPEGYLHKWKTFLEFLLNEKLNIEILIMVKFGEWFYERIINFLIGSDKHPYIIQGTSSKPLPNGYRAHQMPEMVEIWIDELKNALQSPDEIFIKELQTARDLLNEQEFLNLADKVQLAFHT
ncbi:3270_t:CDS:2 [Entrophospora sp. SA101]|nr:3270_t:CDS:2 [Entrophospora sp. SA101]